MPEIEHLKFEFNQCRGSLKSLKSPDISARGKTKRLSLTRFRFCQTGGKSRKSCFCWQRLRRLKRVSGKQPRNDRGIDWESWRRHIFQKSDSSKSRFFRHSQIFDCGRFIKVFTRPRDLGLCLPMQADRVRSRHQQESIQTKYCFSSCKKCPVKLIAWINEGWGAA